MSKNLGKQDPSGMSRISLLYSSYMAKDAMIKRSPIQSEDSCNPKVRQSLNTYELCDKDILNLSATELISRYLTSAMHIFGVTEKGKVTKIWPCNLVQSSPEFHNYNIYLGFYVTETIFCKNQVWEGDAFL